MLSRLLGVRPARPHRTRTALDLAVPAADGVVLLAHRTYPVDVERAPLVLLRSPYGRGGFGDGVPQLLAERGYQVLYQSLRGTAGSGGTFDGFTIHPADGDGTLRWLRDQPWFGGVLATWGASYLGFAQWELAAREVPEWRIAVLQDAPSEFAHQFMFPGGAFALGNALGWVQITDRMFATGWSTARQLLGVATSSRALGRAASTRPVAAADRALTGHTVPWFQEWITHGPDDGYWAATDHRRNVPRMPPRVHMEGGWSDFFLPGMLADRAALTAAGRDVRLVVGPWVHGRGLYTRAGMRDAVAALDAAFAGGPPPSGVRVFVTGARRWIDLPDWPPPSVDTPWYLHPGGGLGHRPARAGGPPSRFRYDPADPTPTAGGTAVGLSAGPVDNRRLEARPDVLVFTGPELAADVTAIGPVRARLHVRSSHPHVDLVVRLCDVSPRGRSTNVADGIVRLDEATTDAVDVELWPVAHRFRRGHRVRVQVSGGGHPRFGRNPGTGEPYASGTGLRAGVREVVHDADRRSALWLPVVDGS